MLAKTASSVLTNLGAISAKPFAFLIVIAYGGLWLFFQRETLDGHGIATLATQRGPKFDDKMKWFRLLPSLYFRSGPKAPFYSATTMSPETDLDIYPKNPGRTTPLWDDHPPACAWQIAPLPIAGSRIGAPIP